METEISRLALFSIASNVGAISGVNIAKFMRSISELLHLKYQDVQEISFPLGVHWAGLLNAVIVEDIRKRCLMS